MQEIEKTATVEQGKKGVEPPNMEVISITPLNHRDLTIARQIHAIRQFAYAQEARLLQVSQFPPLDITAEDIQQSRESFLGAISAGLLVGSVSTEPSPELDQVLISSLVVHPDHQRRGIARALMIEVLRDEAPQVFTVSTGVKNQPALALYRSLGFEEYRFSTVGPEKLQIVTLRLARPHFSIERKSLR